MTQVFSHGAVEVENEKTGDKFKVNGQRVKPYILGEVAWLEVLVLKEP